MFKRLKEAIRQWIQPIDNNEETYKHYTKLRRNIFFLMLTVTVIPLTIMALINYHQYQNSLKREILDQSHTLVSKTKHSIEMYLQERLSAIQYIAHAYKYDELSNSDKLRNVFYTMQNNFSGFVDLGLINPQGTQVNYVGPYDLEGKDYSEHETYQEVRIKGSYISDVFLGYRKFPHLVIAVERKSPSGRNWVLRSSIDIEQFNDIIASMGLGPNSDAFLLNRNGVIQTPSKFYGKVLDSFPLEMPPKSFQPTVVERKDPSGSDIYLTYVYFSKLEYVLCIAKPSTHIFSSWYALKGQLIAVFLFGLLIIMLAIYKITDFTIKRIKQADERREATFRQLEYNQKLSSIGRMAAGVAHEVNNPLAIINEKAGLLQDLIYNTEDFPIKNKLLDISNSIIRSVDRARGITYRLLGFARRIDVQYEWIDVNKVLQDVASFLETEAKDKDVEIVYELNENLKKIKSDQGQLEQVFLNILNNALAALEDGGRIDIKSWEESVDKIGIAIQDNGYGMSKETLKHIFEPFFTTKKGYGTGLGLSITHGIVKKLHGDISVDSKVNVGTTFYIYLPKSITGEI